MKSKNYPLYLDHETQDMHETLSYVLLSGIVVGYVLFFISLLSESWIGVELMNTLQWIFFVLFPVWECRKLSVIVHQHSKTGTGLQQTRRRCLALRTLHVPRSIVEVRVRQTVLPQLQLLSLVVCSVRHHGDFKVIFRLEKEERVTQQESFYKDQEERIRTKREEKVIIFFEWMVQKQRLPFFRFHHRKVIKHKVLWNK